MIIRHGTRFPGKEDTKSMISSLPELQKKIIENFNNSHKLPADFLERITAWKLSFNDSHTMVLTEEGENELTDLAERMQARFPETFPEEYHKELYKVNIRMHIFLLK